MPAPELSILMSAYNEEATIERAVERVLEADIGADSFELIVVENGSTDATREVLEGREWPQQVRIVHIDENKGKGAGVRAALVHATGTYSAILDADLEYDPADLSHLLRPLLTNRANVVLGVRAFDGFTSHSFVYVLGNKGVTLFANILFNVYIRDLMSCHKMMRTDLFRSLALKEPGFAIEAEIVARLLQHGERIYETPVSYQARPTNAGKKLTWVDGLRVVRTLVRCRLRR
jgi:glycosyltransferase involved in cell wall biosynthesis